MSNKQQARQRKNAASNNVDFTKSEESKLLIETHLKNGKSIKEVVDLLRAAYSLTDTPWDAIKEGMEALVEETQANISLKTKRAIKEATQAIKEGKDSDTLPPVESITVDEALKRFAFIKLGQQVFDLENPSSPPMTYKNFVATYAASKHVYEDKSLIEKPFDPATAKHQVKAKVTVSRICSFLF